MFWQSLNTRFQKAPVKFAKEQVILPGHGLYAQTSLTGPSSVDLKDQTKGGASYLSMGGDKRVLYANLQKTASGIAVQYSQIALKGWIPIFWLPWNAGRVVKTTLIDKRPGSTDSPRIFLTSAVNGCSVFVEGDSGNPTVYHSNAMGYDPHGINRASKTLRRQRMDIMKQRLDAIPEPKHGAQGNTRVVEGRHYMDDFTKSPDPLRQAQLLALLQKKLGKRTSIGSGAKAASTAGRAPYQVDPTYMYEGTVFGVKDKTGNWGFWYQCRVQVTVFTLRDRSADPNLYSSWSSTSHWLPSKVEPFWPHGGGSALARSNPPLAWPG